MGADTQQAVESHTGSPEGVEMPSDGPVTDGDTSEQENEILEAAVTELEQSSQSDVESHEDSTSATESESPETAPPEPKEETAVVPSSEPHEEPAVQEVPSEPEEVVQEAKQEVSQHDSNPPQKPAKEQPEVQKEDAAPPAGITSPTAGQPSMFQGPIFIPVPYGQPGGQQGFMAVYPPQVMTGQQGVTPAVQPCRSTADGSGPRYSAAGTATDHSRRACHTTGSTENATRGGKTISGSCPGCETGADTAPGTSDSAQTGPKGDSAYSHDLPEAEKAE